MTLAILAHLLRLGPALDTWRRWQEAAARLLHDAVGVRERLRSPRPPRGCPYSPIDGDPDAEPQSHFEEHVRRVRASGGMACTTGDPVGLDPDPHRCPECARRLNPSVEA